MYHMNFNFFILRKSSNNFFRNYSKTDRILEKLKEMATNHNRKTLYFTRKENMKKYQSKTAKIEVLGSGAHGAPSSVNFFSENGRYLFNCGEGLQRISSEWRVKISRVPHVFITYPSWKNIGGLIGYCLAVEAAGIPELFIHGHSSIETLIKATSSFVNLRRIKVIVESCDNGMNFSDEILNIKYVQLYPSTDKPIKSFSDSKVSGPEITENKNNNDVSNEESSDDMEDSKDDFDYYGYLRKNHFKNKVLKKETDSKKRSHSEVCKTKNHSKEKFALSYICKTSKIKGKLLIDKCIDLGLKPGPLFGMLKNGENIKLENGKVINSTDVTLPDTPGAIIIVIECPSEDYLDSLLKEPAFFEHQTGEIEPNNIAEVVIHFTESYIVKHSKYKEWMNRFPKTTKHIFINDDNQSLGLQSVYKHQYSLNLIHPDIFPLLYSTSPPFSKCNDDFTNSQHTIVTRNIDNENPEQEIENLEHEIEYDEYEDLGDIYENLDKKSYYKCNGDSHIKGETMCEIYVRPVKNYDFSLPKPITGEGLLEDILSIEGLNEELNILKTNISKTKVLDKRQYPKILFLGTGSSGPSKKRNASGIMIFLDEKNLVLFDCGEGTYGQMVRFFGKEKARDFLRKTIIIFVSHLHADHHLGLITLLKERKAAFYEKNATTSQINSPETSQHYEKPFLFAPPGILRWLNIVNKNLENIEELYNFIPNYNECMEEQHNIEKMKALKMSGLKDLQTTLVHHCSNAFGVAITHNSGWKITYSGDTKPCQSLVKLGMNCDILIHEATMSDSLYEEAALKRHSTISQAIEIGKKMNAKFILLTHFSQRFSDLPHLDKMKAENVGIAFDYMMVSYNELQFLPSFIDVLKILFSKSYEKMKQKLNIMNKRKRRALESSDRPSKILELEEGRA